MTVARQPILLAGALIACGAAIHGPAYAQVTESAAPDATAAAQINPTGRDIQLTVPVRDREFTLGEVLITLTADQRVLVPVRAFADAVSSILPSDMQDRLARFAAENDMAEPADFAEVGLEVRYDPAKIELSVILQTDERGRQSVSLTNRAGKRVGDALTPAPFSAYLNYDIRTDFIHENFGGDTGVKSPAATLIGGVNLYGLALETEGRYLVQSGQPNWQRFSSRAVYDVKDWSVRLSAGDLRPLSRGFQSTTDILGGGIERIYSDIDPTRMVRSGGYQAIALDGPSQVEVIVNGATVNRLNLDAGNYDLRDFPLAFGGNEVQLVVTDASGRREVLDFSAYVDDYLLGEGIAEFALYGGIEAPFLNGERTYLDDRWHVTGFVRYGLTDTITVGADAQANVDGRLFGANTTFGTGIGLFTGEVSYSDLDAFGTGYAGRAAYQASFGETNESAGYLRFEALYRSELYGALGSTSVNNPVEWALTASVSIPFNEDISTSFGLGYDMSRGVTPDRITANAQILWSINDDLRLGVQGRYLHDGTGDDEYSGRVTFTARLGQETFARASYYTRGDELSLAVSSRFEEGADTYDLAAEVQRNTAGLSANASAYYRGNRVEGSLQHVTTYNLDNSVIDDSRTSLQISGGIAFANGDVAVGRKIQNSFVIVEPHPSLGDADVYVDYDDKTGRYVAATDWLGPALVPDVSAGIDRSLKVSVPDAPVGYDLGKGVIPIAPTYKSGFGVTVGSDYTIIAVGDFRRSNGEPLSLVSGEARLEGDDTAPVVQLFTNNAGRFAASGLKPGRWIVTMNSDPPTRFMLDVPDGTVGMWRAGTLEAK